MASMVTIPKQLLVQLLVSTELLLEECDTSADFGDVRGRGHQSELDAIQRAENAVAEVRRNM